MRTQYIGDYGRNILLPVIAVARALVADTSVAGVSFVGGMLFRTVISLIYSMVLGISIILYRKTHNRFYFWLAAAVPFWWYAETFMSPFKMLRFAFGDTPSTRLISGVLLFAIQSAPQLLVLLGVLYFQRDSQ